MIPRKKTAIIVDDERLARKDLAGMLEEFPDVEVIGEADSATSAISLIEARDPDIIFLDIQMPETTGFELLEKIDTQARIIFVTAYDEYAVRAFEVNALDYLLKPVHPDRLRAALERVETSEKELVRKTLTTDDRLFILFGTRYRFLKVMDIRYIASSGDYSEVHLADGSRGLTSKTMTEWEERLPGNLFLRIHRSVIINLDAVVKVEDWFNSTFRVYISGVTEPFTMSRRMARDIRSRLG
jgi:two-component system LytT family response regulator